MIAYFQPLALYYLPSTLSQSDLDTRCENNGFDPCHT
jgi:hypothetical protein